MHPDNLNCPICKQRDQVQQISVLYSQGTTGGRTFARTELGLSTAYTYGISVDQSQLAQRLSPPHYPVRARIWEYVSFYAIIISCTLIVGELFAFFTFERSLPPGYSSHAQAYNVQSFIFFLLFFLAILISAILLLRRGIRQDRRRYEMELSVWQNQYSLWQKLFLCIRDGTLFFPGSPGQYQFGTIDQFYSMITPPDMVRKLIEARKQ